MKHVFDNIDTIAHLWMHKAQSNARNPSNNFFFDGDTIYSYGRHFPIARHVALPDGSNPRMATDGMRRAVLLTAKTYSATTNKHVRTVRSAIAGTFFTVPDVKVQTAGSFEEHKDNLAHYATEITDTLKAAQKARSKRGVYLTRAVQICDEMIGYVKFFGIDGVAVPEIGATNEEIDAIIGAEIAADRERYRAANAEAVARFELEAQQWLDGKRKYYPDVPAGITRQETKLRVYGNQVETSRGASFPVTHAKRGLALVRAVVASGKDWVANGHTCKLGHYAIDHIRVEPTFAKDHGGPFVAAGCHIVSIAEIERIASEVEAWQDNSVAEVTPRGHTEYCDALDDLSCTCGATTNTEVL